MYGKVKTKKINNFEEQNSDSLWFNFKTYFKV